MRHCFAEMDDLSLVGNQRNNNSEINIPASLSFAVISPGIMQLVCITHLFLSVRLSLFKAALSPKNVPGMCLSLVWTSQAFFTFVSLLYCILLLCVLADIHLDGHKAYCFYRVTVMNATI